MARAFQIRLSWLGGALLLTVLVPLGSQAQTVVWDGSAGNGDFNTAANWTPSGVPDSTETAQISINETVTTSAASRVEQLTLTGGAWLQLGANGNVIVDAGTLLNKTTADSVQLFVHNTTAAIDFDTNSLNVLNGAEVDMEGGLLQIDGASEIFPGSSITGHGIIEFTGTTGSNGLDNGGTIRPDGGTLTLRKTPSSNARLGTALDGEIGSYIVTSGSADLVIDLPSGQQYPGVVEVGDGNSISFNQGWHFGRLATIDLTGGALGPATLGGDEIDFSGVMVVEGAGEITANWSCDSFAGIFVTAGSTLTLRGHTNFGAGVLDGDGTLVLEGTMKVGTDRIWAATEFRTGSLTEIAAGFGVRLEDPALLAGGDFHGAVTGADYTLWADHLGQAVNLSPAIAIPEPQGWVLALLGAAALAGSRRRRRRGCYRPSGRGSSNSAV